MTREDEDRVRRLEEALFNPMTGLIIRIALLERKVEDRHTVDERWGNRVWVLISGAIVGSVVAFLGVKFGR